MARIGIFYHSDPAGGIPSGIDSIIRGILRYAPDDLHYTLYGASSDLSARPLGRFATVEIGGRNVEYMPLVSIAAATRGLVPRTVQYMRALRAMRADAALRALDILDFHRVEPLLLFRGDARPKNLMLHQDMSIIRDPNSDILWRHAPWLYERIERSLFEDVQRIFTVRESAVGRYSKLYPELATKFAFIPTWVDSEIFTPGPAGDVRARFGVPAGRRMLMFAGRFDQQKDPLLLLRALRSAMRSRDDLHLLLVGDGVLRAAIESFIADHALGDRVTLTGALDRDSVVAALRAADLFVLSSAYEGMPIAVLEALAVGVPVVSTDVGEVRRVVRDGVNGALVPSRDPEAVATAIALALSRLDSLRGAPCENSVRPFHARTVLASIYDNHRHQAERRAA